MGLYLHCLYLFLQVERDGDFYPVRAVLRSVAIPRGKWQRTIKTWLKWLQEKPYIFREKKKGCEKEVQTFKYLLYVIFFLKVCLYLFEREQSESDSESTRMSGDEGQRKRDELTTCYAGTLIGA